MQLDSVAINKRDKHGTDFFDADDLASCCHKVNTLGLSSGKNGTVIADVYKFKNQVLELRSCWSYYTLTMNTVATGPRVNSSGSKSSWSRVA